MTVILDTESICIKDARNFFYICACVYQMRNKYAKTDHNMG